MILEVDNILTFEQLSEGQAIVASTLFPHECKISTMHFKVARTFENNEIVPSKSLMEFSAGFRRLVIKPTFSMELNAAGAKGDKNKYMRFLRKDM